MKMAISMVKVKEQMERHGLKKFDLRKMGFSPNVIDKVLSGELSKEKRVDTETINRLCKVLDCQPGAIMEFIEEPAPVGMLEPVEASTQEGPHED
jgi:DNA-binding Xre family transcriptional regulator